MLRDNAKLACFPSLVIAFAVMHVPFDSFAEYHEVEDIKPFGLIDVSGHFEVGYFMDDRGYIGSSEQRSTLQEKLFLRTESFVYHPGLLNMEIGGGPIFLQQQFDEISGDTRQKDTLFDFLVRLNILELKPYPVSVWYERSHPAVTTGLAGRFLTQGDEVGVSGHVSGLLGGSTTVNYSLSTRDDEGSGFGAVVDNSSEIRAFGIQTVYGRGNHLKFRYNTSYLDSASGSAGLQIVRSTTDLQTGEVIAKNVFGEQRKIQLYQSLYRLQQSLTSTTDTQSDITTYSANLVWENTEKVHTNFRYRQNRNLRKSVVDLNTDFKDAEFSILYKIDPDFYVTASANHEIEEQQDFNRDETAFLGLLNYTRPTDFGSWSMSASMRGARVNQEASANTIAVFDEPHVLAGTAQVSLTNDFVVVDSIVVSNAVQTQTFIEGIDYRVVTVGSTTSIQRLLNGNIADGETVLVDYIFETSGTVNYDIVDSSVTLNVGFLKTLNAFVNYGFRDTRLREGEFTIPVNDGTGLEYGVSASNQFLDGWSLSARYSHLDREEAISPFSRDSLDVSLSTRLFGTWKLLMSAGLAQVDYEDSQEDVDQVVYRMGISGRPVLGGILTYDLSNLRDDGGSLYRKQFQHRLDFQWTYRQFRLIARVAYSDELLGESKRDNTTVTAQVTRFF